jgi:phage-related holin
LFFLPEAIQNYFGKIGIASLFSIIYCLFETLSIFKNMIRCKIPLPNKLKKYIEKLLKEFTSEVKEGELNDNKR